jgi:predicted peptidase
MRPLRTLAAAFAIASIAVAGCSGGGSSPLQGSKSASKAVRKTDAVVALGSYNINPAHVYVAGISSGGFMAVQMHFAYSGTF